MYQTPSYLAVLCVLCLIFSDVSANPFRSTTFLQWAEVSNFKPMKFWCLLSGANEFVGFVIDDKLPQASLNKTHSFSCFLFPSPYLRNGGLLFFYFCCQFFVCLFSYWWHDVILSSVREERLHVNLLISKSGSLFVFHSSRSSDDLLDIDFSQGSFPSLNSESPSAGSQRNSLQLSSSDAASSMDAELKSQSTTDLRLTSGSLAASSPGI